MTSRKQKRTMKEFLPWVEKYRPRLISEIAHQSHVISVLQRVISSNANNLPHLLFYGPPGTGKTSTILALCLELFSSETKSVQTANLWKRRVLELNASDERGINVVRNKIKKFAQLSINTSLNNSRKVPAFKIIILDEADCMTKDAQTALRRTMEKYSNITRFCLICNYVSKIIAPITSRCAKFRFQPLSKTSMVDKLQYIIKAESICITDEVLDEIIDLSNGDMRKCITLLQSCAIMKCRDEYITVMDIETVCVRIPFSLIRKIICACFYSQNMNGSEFESIVDICNIIIADGYSVILILPVLLKFFIYESAQSISNLAKAEICLAIAEADKMLVDGACEYLQIMNVLNVIAKNITRETLEICGIKESGDESQSNNDQSGSSTDIDVDDDRKESENDQQMVLID